MTPDSLGTLEQKPPADDPEAVTATAVAAAGKAGDVQMRVFRNGPVPCTCLPYDVKTETDRECEKVILDTILARFPDHAVLTEESGELPGSGPYTWIVDPLDGTVNFCQGLPFFCVSIACYRNPVPSRASGGLGSGLDGTPVVGVIFLPFTQEMFLARSGRGAFLNNRPIRVSPLESASHAVVTVSFGKTHGMMQCMSRRLTSLLPRVRKARCLGAVAAELAYISAGFLGGLLYEGIKPWDFAAGRILLEEAGGFLEAAETNPGQWRVLAGVPGIRQTLRSIIG